MDTQEEKVGAVSPEGELFSEELSVTPEQSEPVTPEVSPETAVTPESVNAVQVYDAGMNFVREYSEEVHGENFLELAKQYAVNNDCTLKVK